MALVRGLPQNFDFVELVYAIIRCEFPESCSNRDSPKCGFRGKPTLTLKRENERVLSLKTFTQRHARFSDSNFPLKRIPLLEKEHVQEAFSSGEFLQVPKMLLSKFTICLKSSCFQNVLFSCRKISSLSFCAI